jgi:hypothetical protein
MDIRDEFPSRRKQYSFIWIFYILAAFIPLIGSFAGTRTGLICDISTFLAYLAVGILYDSVSARASFITIYIFSALVAIFDVDIASSVLQAQEVIIFSYTCEIVTDNTKVAFALEIIILKVIFSTAGEIARSFYYETLVAKIILIICCIIVLASMILFDEVPKCLRPNFIEKSIDTAPPKLIGLCICGGIFLAVALQEAIFFSYFAKLYYIEKSFITSLCYIGVVPLGILILYNRTTNIDLKYVMIGLLSLGLIAWACLVAEDLFYGIMGVLEIEIQYIKCAALITISRVLGPYYGGKYVASGLGVRFLLALLPFSDWYFCYYAGIASTSVTVIAIAAGMKYCEYHRDYVIGHTYFELGSKKKSNFKIKLKRASVLQ